MSEQQPSQSLNISGGNISNAQLGQAGRDLTQNQTIRQGSGEPELTRDQVVALLAQFEDLLKQSGLPEAEQEKALRHLETVKDEAQTDEPDKGFALKSFQRATKVLKDASDTVEAGHTLWQNLEAIAKSLAPWFGVAVNALLLL
jgi:tRNA C32,U32 (ribose-2'-O)-methylase TrmJ